jgi:hypothetical protein
VFFLAPSFSGAERRRRRVAKIGEIEKEFLKGGGDES